MFNRLQNYKILFGFLFRYQYILVNLLVNNYDKLVII